MKIILTVLPVCILLLVTDVKTFPLRASSIPANFQTLLSSPERIVRFETSLKGGMKHENVLSLREPGGRKRSKLITRTSASPENDTINDGIVEKDDDLGGLRTHIEQEKTSIWRVESENLFIRIGSCDDNKLESDHAFVIVKDEGSGKIEYKNTTKDKPESYVYTVYYWIGKRASDTDRGEAASFALLLSLEMPNRIKIRRETDGHESKAFKALFEQNENDAAAFETIDLNRKRMFVVEGKVEMRLKEVELRFVYILNDCSCFVFVSQKVYVGCGDNASNLHKMRAKELAKILMKKKGLDVDEEIKIHNVNKLFSGGLSQEEENDLHAFFSTFEDEPSENQKQRIVFTPEEMRRIFGQTKRIGDGTEYFNVEIIRIYASDHTRSIEEEPYLTHNKLAVVEQLNTDVSECYLVDSHSNVGIFVWMGAGAETFLRIAAVQRAELYLKKKGYHHATPITFVEEGDLPVDTWVADMVHLMKPENNDDDAPLPPMLEIIVDK